MWEGVQDWAGEGLSAKTPFPTVQSPATLNSRFSRGAGVSALLQTIAPDQSWCLRGSSRCQEFVLRAEGYWPHTLHLRELCSLSISISSTFIYLFIFETGSPSVVLADSELKVILLLPTPKT